MTNIEQKALELCNEVQAERNHAGSPWNSPTILNEALYRAIEQHERFRQEVSDAVVETKGGYGKFWEGSTPHRTMSRFIIAKPDPLVEVLKDADDMVRVPDAPSYPEAIRAALAKRGLEIREIGK